MICPEDKLDSAINTDCPTTFGMERVGFLCLRSEINPKSESGYIVDFVPRLMIPIYQPSENPFAPKSDGEKNAYGLTKFSKSIEVFIIQNTALTQKQILQLRNEDWVAVLTQRDGQNIVFGFERGLVLKTTAQELMSTDTHGGILLTFDENYTNTPMLFANDNVIDWSKLDTIYGGNISSGDLVVLDIDVAKVGYVKLPNGVILTTVSGSINETYTGVNGAITYYIPKDITSTSIEVSDLAGSVIYNGLNPLSLIDNVSLVGVSAPYIVELSVSGCSLTAQSIGDQLLSFAKNNPTAIGAYGNFELGANATYLEVETYLLNLNVIADDLVGITLASWTLTFN